LTEKFGGDEQRLRNKLALARFRMPEDATFDVIFASQNADNIGEIINKALHKIEEENPERLTDIFTVNFNSQATRGQISQRNKMLRAIISDFAKNINPHISQKSLTMVMLVRELTKAF
jgi:type I restriction enzyme M protein